MTVCHLIYSLKKLRSTFYPFEIISLAIKCIAFLYLLIICTFRWVFFNFKLRISFVKLQTIFLCANWFNQSDPLPTVHHLTFSTIYGCGGHLGHVTRTIWSKLCSRVLRSLHMKFELYWSSGFRGDVWKCHSRETWRYLI